MIVVRYADDLVAGFEHEDDARRFLDAMYERFEAFSLSLHPDKTRLIEFGRHAAVDRKKRGVGRPETFAFLGFTFICGKSRRGAFQLHRKTRRDRMRAKLQEIKAELRQRMHQTIPAQGHWLRQVVTATSPIMRYPQIAGRSLRSGITWPTSGVERFGGAAKKTASRGIG